MQNTNFLLEQSPCSWLGVRGSRAHQPTATIKWPWRDNTLAFFVIFIFRPRVQNTWVEIPERFRPLGDFVTDLNMLSRVVPTGTPPGLSTPTTLHLSLPSLSPGSCTGTANFLLSAQSTSTCNMTGAPAHCPQCQRRCTEVQFPLSHM